MSIGFFPDDFFQDKFWQDEYWPDFGLNVPAAPTPSPTMAAIEVEVDTLSVVVTKRDVDAVEVIVNEVNVITS